MPLFHLRSSTFCLFAISFLTLGPCSYVTFHLRIFVLVNVFIYFYAMTNFIFGWSTSHRHGHSSPSLKHIALLILEFGGHTNYSYGLLTCMLLFLALLIMSHLIESILGCGNFHPHFLTRLRTLHISILHVNSSIFPFVSFVCLTKTNHKYSFLSLTNDI